MKFIRKLSKDLKLSNSSRKIPAQQTLVTITYILMNSIIELPCERQKCSEHLKVFYDIVIEPLLPYVCDHCMES
jgi:hypothetical protein